jgi:hypothetical protein
LTPQAAEVALQELDERYERLTGGR